MGDRDRSRNTGVDTPVSRVAAPERSRASTAIPAAPLHHGPARSGGRGNGLHHPIRWPRSETLHPGESAEPGGDDVVPEAVAVECMTALREALGALQALNGTLTREFLARSAVGSAYRQEHWDIMNDLMAEAGEIQRKALRAHNY